MKRCHSPEDSTTTTEQPPPSKICSVPNPDYFPSDVLKFMKQNAKPRMSLKLMKLCKYFQHKIFPYLVITSIKHCWGQWTYITLDGKTDIKESLDDVPNNLWITEWIIISMQDVNFKAFVDKVVASDAHLMHFVSQTVPFHIIKPLCANIKEFTSISCYLRNENRDIISLDELFEGLPNLETFNLNLYCPNIVSLEHINRVLPPRLKVIQITHFHESFNFGIFADFMLQHQNIRYVFDSNQYLQIEYLTHCCTHIHRIIQGWNCQNHPPSIRYFGQMHTESGALRRLQELHNALKYFSQIQQLHQQQQQLLLQ